MSVPDHASSTFSAFCSRHAGDYVAPGTVQVNASVLLFRPDPALPDPVVTFLLAEVTTIRRDRTQAEVQIVVGKRKLRLRLLPALADRLWTVLQQRCRQATSHEIGALAEAIDVSGPVALELNAVLTVSGTVTVTSSGMTYEPGGDARLLGQKTFTFPIAEIESVERADLNRRVIVRTRAHPDAGGGAGAKGRSVVLRGAGAQRAWIALHVLLDVLAAGGTMAPVLRSASVDGLLEQPGLIGIGARGFGFGGDPRLGAAGPSFWADLAYFQSLRPSDQGLEVVCAERRLTVHGDAADAMVKYIPERWLNAMGPVERPDGRWMVRSVLHHDGALEAGVLALDVDALRFHAVSGRRFVLATRGVPAKVSVDDADVRMVRIEADGVETRLTMLNAMTQARSLGGVFGSTAWSSPEEGLQPHPLDVEDQERITGLSAYARLVFHDSTIATAPDAMLAPEPEQVRLTMGFPRSPPAVPFPCLLEVVNGKGRFLAPGTVVTAQPTGARSSRTNEVRVAVVFRFGGAVRLANRRGFFRLPLRESLPSIEGVTPDGAPVLLDGATMVNVSRSGCGMLTAAAIPVDTMLTMTVMLDGEVPLTLSARVVQCSQVDRMTWRLGAVWLAGEDEPGARLYNDRELAFLRRRRRED